MNNHYTASPIENRFLSIIGVAAFCYLVIHFSTISIISKFFSLQNSFFVLQFEQHFWQYLFSFLAVVVLSRGHLWSYGINSQNLKRSMVWLVWLYGVIIMATLIFGESFLPVHSSNLPVGTRETFVSFLTYWMSSPVANQILFFSFGQTVLMKQWGDSFSIKGFPVVILFSSILFAFGATSSQFQLGEYSIIPTFILGLFSGVVYWKTNSLITPMLGHAFYFGFPLFIHILKINLFQ
ncbi:MAG: CPBP family intramembrane metalloprotease [Bacteroidota bacterium]|nr:CPBP family intramembrane metalloprotease [Bacteroidota bacterium]